LKKPKAVLGQKGVCTPGPYSRSRVRGVGKKGVILVKQKSTMKMNVRRVENYSAKLGSPRSKSTLGIIRREQRWVPGRV